MTARFFNADDGSVTQFLNKDINANNSGLINEERVGTYNLPIKFYEIAENYNVVPEDDLYYKITFDRSNYSYNILRWLG
jgi:hypothetical protein